MYVEVSIVVYKLIKKSLDNWVSEAYYGRKKSQFNLENTYKYTYILSFNEIVHIRLKIDLKGYELNPPTNFENNGNR